MLMTILTRRACIYIGCFTVSYASRSFHVNVSVDGARPEADLTKACMQQVYSDRTTERTHGPLNAFLFITSVN